MAGLVPSTASDHRDPEALHVRAAELQSILETRLADVDRLGSELAMFTMSYRQRVGLLYEQLDELEREIAEAEHDVRAAREGGSASADRPPPARPEPLPRFTTDAVRKLFRDVAKAIHPDLAGDELARHRRHMLMVEANRAYAVGDEERLRAILEAWGRRLEPVQGEDSNATARIARRIQQLEEQITVADSELAALHDSPMWKLKAMVDEASGRGRDLVRDMVGRLKRDILVAHNRLDAIRSIR
ncbi:MAG: hypothetical protein HOP16_00880 [Acidobacteria bacterium]|nr:hypothetical protein [Acidobacteriota bacterium]